MPFKCPFQPKPAWHSVVLGSLRMGFSVLLTFLCHPEHSGEMAPQGWNCDQTGLGAQEGLHMLVMPPKPLSSLCRTGRGNKKDS